jgi:hypothetical protein
MEDISSISVKTFKNELIKYTIVFLDGSISDFLYKGDELVRFWDDQRQMWGTKGRFMFFINDKCEMVCVPSKHFDDYAQTTTIFETIEKSISQGKTCKVEYSDQVYPFITN